MLAQFVIVLVSHYSAGQQRFKDFKLPCDSIENQAGMNQCAHEKFQLLDSIMNEKYQSILKNLQTDIENAKADKDSEMVKCYADLRQIIIKSQKRWSRMADENAEFYGKMYEGGSMRSMAISNSRIANTINRIHRLEGIHSQLNL